MASLSVKDRLAAIKAKLQQQKQNEEGAAGGTNTATTTSSTNNISPPPPVAHLPEEQNNTNNNQTVDKNNNNSGVSSSITDNQSAVPEEDSLALLPKEIYQKQQFPDYVMNQPSNAAIGLAQAQYLTSLMTRSDSLFADPEKPNRVGEFKHFSAQNFAQQLVQDVTNNDSQQKESGQRRQREEQQSSSSSSSVLIPPTYDKRQRKRDLSFLGVPPQNRKCEDVNEKYTLGSAISQGAFGVVYNAHLTKKPNETFALKKIKDNWFTESREGFPHYLLRELDLCLRAKHPNVMESVEIASNRPTEKEYAGTKNNRNDGNNTITSNMKSFFLGELCSQVTPPTPGPRPSLYLSTEYGGRNLRHEIMRVPNRPLDMAAVKHIMTQILKGLDYLHQNQIIHRDLKPTNVLVNSLGIVKVCDLGLARSINTVNNTNRRQLSSNVVTLFYRAPELHFGADNYHAAVDVFSAGCIFAELLTQEPLFVAHEEEKHLEVVSRILGVPTEKSFPGYRLFPNVPRMFENVKCNPQDVKEVLEDAKMNPKVSPTSSLNRESHPFLPPCHRSPILERHIRKLRSLLFSDDEAGKRLSDDPKYKVTENCMELLNMMLQWSPKMRITCEEALRHPFLSGEEAPQAASLDIEHRRQYSRQMMEQQQQNQQQ